jgi:acetyl esterase/lipase
MSLQMRAVGLLMRATRRRGFTTEAAGRELLAAPKGSAWPPREVSQHCHIRLRATGEFDVFEVVPPAARADVAVVYLHGGAFVRQIAKQHWALIADIAVQLGCEVHVPIYGLAPAHDWSQADALLDEVIARLVDDGRSVLLVGDSAGGTLALLAAQKHGPEVVRRVTLISPWLDLSMSNPAVAEVQHDDPWLALPGLRPMADAWAAGVPLNDPRISPLFGRMDRLPPVDIWVGTRDVTVVDCRVLRDRLPAESSARYHEEPGAIHVYPLLPVPEGRAAVRQLIEDLRKSL